MLLTTKGRYAVMAIVDIAQNSLSEPEKISNIASRQNISISYLEQILNKLKNAQIVNSIKGPGGGYILKETPKNILISDIITAVAEPIRFTNCSNKKSSCSNNNVKCTTHPLWKGLEKQVNNYLSNISIADVCNGKLIH